jgi:hypothetical protein
MSIVLKLGKICVTNESLGVSVTCTTEAIAWRGGGRRTQGVAKCAKKMNIIIKNLIFCTQQILNY